MSGLSKEEEKRAENSEPEEIDVDHDSDPKTVPKIFSDGSSEDDEGFFDGSSQDEDEDEESSSEEGSVEYSSLELESSDYEIDSSESEDDDDDERYKFANRIRRELGLKKPRSYKELLEYSKIINKSDTYIQQIPSKGWRFGRVGKEADKDLVREYNRQVRESDGFDVAVFPGPCPNATILPVYFKEDPELHNDLVVMATKALREYNLYNVDSNREHRMGVPYKFKKIKRATSYAVQGMIFLITFQARGVNGIIRIFRARVWNFMRKNKVLFVQIQPHRRSGKKGKGIHQS